MDGGFKGIRVIGVMDMTFGVCSLCYFAYGAVSSVFDLKKTPTGMLVVGLVLLVLVLLLGIWLIRLGRQTLRLNPKAIHGNIILAVFVIMEFLGSQLQYQSQIAESIRWGLLIYSVWLLFYLNRPSVREQFKTVRNTQG